MSRSSRDLVRSPYIKFSNSNKSHYEIQKQQKDNTKNLLQIAKQYYNNNQISSAIQCFNSLTLHQCIQAHYMLAICYITYSNYQKALLHLKMVKQSTKQTTIHLLISICRLNLSQYQEAIQELTEGIKINQNAQLLIYRSKTYMKMGLYQEALIDIRKAYQMQTLRPIHNTYIECLRILKRQQQCLAVIQNTINDYKEKQHIKQTQLTTFTPNLVNKVLVLSKNEYKLLSVKVYYLISQVYCLISFGKLSEAQQILPKLRFISQQQQSSTYYYLKGLKEYKESMQLIIVDLRNECVLSWNQCLNLQNNKKSVKLSLEELSIFYMRNRDFYESLQYLLRVQLSNNNKEKKRIKHNKKLSNVEIDNHQDDSKMSIQILMKLSEGVTFLMKRKIQEAIQLLIGVNIIGLSHLTHHYHFLYNLYYNAMGFGYFSQGKHQQALYMYQQMLINNQQQNLSQMDHQQQSYHQYQSKQYNYNINLCLGILAEDTNAAMEYFQKAKQQINRSEPYFYIAVNLVCENVHKGILPSQLLFNVLSILDQGLSIGENSHMFYYRGLIYVCLGMSNEALEDVDQAIEKSQDNVAKYFFLRGIIFMIDKNYEQAISQFSTCLSIDDKFKDAYLQRGKCLILNGQNTTSALMDIYEHPQSIFWKYAIAFYQRDFQQVITNCVDQNLREMAYFHLGQFDKAGAAGKLVLSTLHNNNNNILSLLNEALQINSSVGCLQIEDILFLKAFSLFKLQLFSQCEKVLLKIQDIIHSNEKPHQYFQEEQKRLLMAKINIILIRVRSNKIQQAIEILNTLLKEVYEGEIYQQLIQLINCLEHPQQPFQINMFQNIAMISDFFALQHHHNLKFKFYIPFPRIKSTQLEIPNYQKILTEFTIKTIQNIPQAPWIRRGQYGVLFTNDVQNFDNLRIHTDQTETLNKIKIKQSLQLGSSVLNKLKKITQKDTH